ncbi:MAG: glutamyl-tRNA synthetase, partial [Solirubrobacteraceae bacterium]|nr:glutamyl-tRNA synthetase [Solirubrobacteraceae bacterium]
DDTFFTVEDLQREFALERVSRSPAVFDEQKLRWMNGRYLRELAVGDLQRRLEALLGRELRPDVVAIAQEKISTLTEFWPLASFFFEGPADDPAARAKVFGDNGGIAALHVARETLADTGDWSVEGLEQSLRDAADAAGLKPKNLFQPVRVAISGSTISPGIFESVAVLGREETLRRIDNVLSAAA